MIGEPARRRTGFSAEGIAWQLAVAAAVQARVTHRCPHVREFGASATPIVTSLTHGVQVCDACMRRGVEWPAAIEEDHCDVCGRPTRIFCEAAVQMGPEFVLGNVCQTCAWFAERAIGEAAA